MPRRGRWVVVLAWVLFVVGGLLCFRIFFPEMVHFVDHPAARVDHAAAVRRGLAFDFPFLIVFWAGVALACWLPTRELVRYNQVGRRLAWLAGAAAVADLIEDLEAFRLVDGHVDAERWLRYATAVKIGLVPVPLMFALCVLVAWAARLTTPGHLHAGPVDDALAWAREQDPILPASFRARLACWLRGDRPLPPRVPLPECGVPAAKTGISFSGGGIRSAAYNLGALQELQASGELGRADYLSAVSGGSYIACAHAITGAFSEHDAIGTVPPFAPGSVEEQFLRNRTTYLFPGLVGTGYALWRLVRGLAVNVAFILVVLFVFARPYGWAVEERLVFGCREVPSATTTTTLVAPASCAPLPAAVANEPTRRTVSFDPFPGASVVVGGIGGLALLLGLVDMLLRPKERWATRLESWSFRLVVAAAALGILLYLLPWLAARLFSDVTFHDSALDRLPATAAICGAFSSLATVLLLLRRSGPQPPTGGPDAGSSLDVGGIFRKIRAGAAKAGTGLLNLLMTIVGGVVGPVALAAAFVALAMGSMVRPGLDPGQLRVWLDVATVLVLIQGVSDANRWSLQPYYKRRLSSAFVLQRRCEAEGRPVAEEVSFDTPIALTGLLDTPALVVCAAANTNTYGVLPPGRAATGFAFSRTVVDAGILGRVPTAILGTLLGRHYERDFTVPAAMAASGAAVSPVMGKMTKPAYRFLLALTNVRLGVWLPNPARVVGWAKEQPDAKAGPAQEPGPAVAAAQAALARAEADEAAVVGAGTDGGPEAEARLQEARMETQRCRRRLERAVDEATAPSDFRGYPWLPRPTLLFRELLGLYPSTGRFVYVTDGGHYENLGLVELLRRGCESIYCFDAAGDRVDRFTTVADAVAIARTELGIRIDIDPTPMAPPKGSEFNARDWVIGTVVYPGYEDTPGHIVFAKLGVVEEVPADVRSWQETHPTFPTDGTADQLYTDQRFEAYRALGAGTAVRAIAAMREIRGDDVPTSPGPLRGGTTCAPPDRIS